jgi:hypothetical protein
LDYWDTQEPARIFQGFSFGAYIYHSAFVAFQKNKSDRVRAVPSFCYRGIGLHRDVFVFFPLSSL